MLNFAQYVFLWFDMFNLFKSNDIIFLHDFESTNVSSGICFQSHLFDSTECACTKCGINIKLIEGESLLLCSSMSTGLSRHGSSPVIFFRGVPLLHSLHLEHLKFML